MNVAGKKTAGFIGRSSFWLSWPFLYIYLKNSERTRVLLVAEGKVLLIQNWHGPGKWTLPGGGIHSDEKPAMTATRELMEETKIALGTDQLRHMGTQKFRENGLSFMCHYYIAELDQTIKATPRLPEVLSAEWIDAREVSKLRLGADAKAALSLFGVIQ